MRVLFLHKVICVSAMFFESTLRTIVAVLLAIYLIIIAYFKWRYTYWSSRNVPHETPTIPFGNSENPIKRKKSLPLAIADYYKTMKSKGYKYAGYYLLSSPQLIPIHPELIKNIMLKDFSHFVNRGFYYNEKHDPLSAHLFAIEDDKWKNLRAKLTPTFTSGKMKTMFQTVLDCASPMIEKLQELSAENVPVDIKEIVTCFTTDVIGSCAFGVECNSFKYPDAEFRKCGKTMFEGEKMRVFKRTLTAVFPNLSRKLGVKAIKANVSAFLKEMVRTTLEYRHKNNVSRKDFIQLLIDISKTEGLTLNEMSAQAFVFFVAGFETSSSAMTYCFYELAKNALLQDKLRKEIQTILLKYGNITYDSLSEMKYLTQVINETLRMYPPVPAILRVCNKIYHDSDTNLTIEKGRGVIISVYALHHDPQYFPNPEKFDPERFSDENKDNITPFTYLPFGDGPRVCIGVRFGIMQMKVGLVTILSNFKVGLNNKMHKELTYANSPILTTKETLYLDLVKI